MSAQLTMSLNGLLSGIEETFNLAETSAGYTTEVFDFKQTVNQNPDYKTNVLQFVNVLNAANTFRSQTGELPTIHVPDWLNWIEECVPFEAEGMIEKAQEIMHELNDLGHMNTHDAISYMQKWMTIWYSIAHLNPIILFGFARKIVIDYKNMPPA